MFIKLTNVDVASGAVEKFILQADDICAIVPVDTFNQRKAIERGAKSEVLLRNGPSYYVTESVECVGTKLELDK